MIATPSKPPEIRREFLGWDQPVLPEAARRLRARYGRDRTLDLGRVIVVVPGQRAGRRLQELLAFLAEDDNLRLTPPDVVTESRLPEMLYTPKQPFADEIVQQLAWAQALRDLPAATRQHVVPHPPALTDTLRWLELGAVLRRLHVELAADGLDFAAVQRHGPELADFLEAERWQALVALQQLYLELLDQQQLWDIQTARLKAIEFHELRTDCDIILLGTVDLNHTLRQMLEQLAARVTAYVVAPENLADCFDGHGCLVPDRWCHAILPLADDQIGPVDGPEDQAAAVTAWLGALAGRFRKDEVAIGVPDESLVSQLQWQLEESGTRARWVEGTRVGETAPYRLLGAAVRFAGQRRYDDLAALIRHPDLEDWLLQPGSGNREPRCESRSAPRFPLPASRHPVMAASLPAQLDRFYNTHLPSRVEPGAWGVGRGATPDAPHLTPHAPRPTWPDLAPALERIDTWLADAFKNLPLRQWGDVFRNMLSVVYGRRVLHCHDGADQQLYRTFRLILEECARVATVPDALDTVALSAADAFQVVLGPLATQAVPPPADPDAVEILGWLELPLDDSRALIVTSFNEGFVPTSTGPEPFLPDRLRRKLGLLHNERRYARDAYAMSVLCHAREELRVVFGRRNADDDPLQPSRLLFACPDDILIRRAQDFFAPAQAPAQGRRLLLAPSGAILDNSLFAVPPPRKSGKKLEYMPVTHFKAYLACPYRYYLRHVRKLEAIDDSKRELDGGAFGTLLHRVLGDFGRDGAGPRLSDREQDIFDYLANRLETRARGLYGRDQRRPAIRLQLEQARRRLRAFASRQTQLVRSGWRIIYAEDDDTDQLAIPFPVDGELIMLVGRIDRIDFHDARRTVRILDYKSADSAEHPRKTHHNGTAWIDLQLPLYRHLWPATRLPVPGDCQVELGYFNLPKQADETDVQLADWDQALLAAADETARDVLRKLRAEVFEPIQRPAPDFSEDFAAICLDHVLTRPAIGDDEEGVLA
jgi:hypothetical protein